MILDLFFPIIWLLGPWSGEILINGNPKVILIALKLNNVFIGVKTWSWYMPITISNFSIFFFKKKVSAGKGPDTWMFFFISIIIAGLIILSSSLNLSTVSQWGFNPKIAILINSSEITDDIKVYYHKNNEIKTIDIDNLEKIIQKTDEWLL